ncbi:MAG: RlmE family RNA methyltransferase [Rhodospirillales bacterium]|nr:RlmE family RNA methyltransferase [Rhodospirillales bacterium]MBO6785959.1 RlmE family RNA methyltransferase [Rhodospirillales bacterium]
MAGKRSSKGSGNRGLHTRVKTAKGRRPSSTRWLQRQLNDPYVQEAKRQGYRSRAAFKLIELDDKFRFLKKGAKVIDLGAAPGGWTQVAMARIGADGHVVGIDLQEMEAIPGADLIQGDFLDDDAPDRLKALLGGHADVVLSDMAAASTGHPQTDHLRIMGLLEVAVDFAADVLAPGGAFVGKVLQGGTENDLLAALKRDFKTVKHAKPPASRSDSAEIYVVATGFRGADQDG